MFSLRRNQIIIAALVVMICVAGYLNYLDTRNMQEDAQFATTPGGEMGAIVLDGFIGNEVVLTPSQDHAAEVFGDTAYPESEPVTETEPGAAVFVNASSESSFFVQAKLNREQDRSRQKETLKNLVTAENLDQQTRTLSAETIVEITRRMESESATEAALVAKGFGDAYVRIDDNWVEVIINKSVITDQELAMLEDIVTRLTGASISQIRLSSVRN